MFIVHFVHEMFINFVCRKCEGNIGKVVPLGEILCDKVETVSVYLSL